MDRSSRKLHFGEPFFLQWNITDRCNLDCAHCYRETPAREPDREDLLRILDSYTALLDDIGRRGRVMFSGGEPMLSPHVFELAEVCGDRGLPVRVLSNGTLIDAPAAGALADAGVEAVQVSIEGPRGLHDRVRGEGTFDRALEGVKALKSAGIEVTLALTLTSANRASLPAVARIARRHADRLHVARHVPIGRGAAMDARPLTAAEMHRAFAWLDRKRRLWRGKGPGIPKRDPLWRALLARDSGCGDCVSGCSIGYNGICIDADGAVYPCRRLPVPLGNVMETPLPEIWCHPALERLRDRDRLEGRCGRCSIRWTCGGCRAVAAAMSGHPMAEDPQCFRRV